ncbi:MAG: hypothetical protein JW809_10025 [Pirellulales bacterium]|nr:hypothetical protein [Pirellulales bacterium]
MIKLLIRAIVLAAAVGGPMLFFRMSDVVAGVKKTIAAVTNSTVEETTDLASVAPPASAPTPVTVARPVPLEGAPVHGFEEVLRFDVSPHWIMSRWTRVSTGMAQLKLQGYRVLLVTGAARDDLAGSLTYYFNPQQQVQKIAFNGTTGDPTELVRYLATRFGFARRLANDGGLFVYEVPNRDGGGVRSVLRIRPAGVVKADQPHRRFHVDLEIERPEETAQSKPGGGFLSLFGQ